MRCLPHTTQSVGVFGHASALRIPHPLHLLTICISSPPCRLGAGMTHWRVVVIFVIFISVSTLATGPHLRSLHILPWYVAAVQGVVSTNLSKPSSFICMHLLWLQAHLGYQCIAWTTQSVSVNMYWFASWTRHTFCCFTKLTFFHTIIPPLYLYYTRYCTYI